MKDYADTIQKLLAKAERAGTEEEASVFYAKAQELMTKHAIDEAMLADAAPSEREAIVSERLVLGRNATGIKARRVMLASIADVNNCHVLMTEGRQTLIVTGHKTDVEFTLMLFTSLEIQAASELAKQGKTSASFKVSFLYAYANRIYARLKAAKAESVREQDVERGTSTALVLADRSSLVRQHVEESHGKLRQGPRARHRFDASGDVAGRAAADRASLGGHDLGARRQLGS